MLAYNALSEYRAYTIREGSKRHLGSGVIIKSDENSEPYSIRAALSDTPCLVLIHGYEDAKVFRIIESPESPNAMVYNLFVEEGGVVRFERDHELERDRRKYR